MLCSRMQLRVAPYGMPCQSLPGGSLVWSEKAGPPSGLEGEARPVGRMWRPVHECGPVWSGRDGSVGSERGVLCQTCQGSCWGKPCLADAYCSNTFQAKMR